MPYADFTYDTYPHAAYDTYQRIRFGGLLLPGTNSFMSFLDLNDQNSWFAQDIQIDGMIADNKLAQYTWQANAAWVGQDFKGPKIVIPALFDTSVSSLSQWSSSMHSAGEQFLSFNSATGIRCKFMGYNDMKIAGHQGKSNYILDLKLNFQARRPFFEDMNGEVSYGPFSVSGQLGGGRTTVTVNNAGTVFTRPRIEIYQDGGTPGKITHIDWSNTGEGTDVAFDIPGLSSGSGGHQFFFNSATQSITVDGGQIAPEGTFPNLYPGNNTMQVNIVTSDTTTSGMRATIYWVQYYAV